MHKFAGLPGHSNESLRTLPCFIQDGSKRWYLLYNEVRSKNMFNSNDLVFHFPKSPPPKKKGGGFRSLENWITSSFSLQFQGVKNLLKPLHIEKPCGVSQPPASPQKNAPCTLGFSETLGREFLWEKASQLLGYVITKYSTPLIKGDGLTTILSRAKLSKKPLQSMI